MILVDLGLPNRICCLGLPQRLRSLLGRLFEGFVLCNPEECRNLTAVGGAIIIWDHVLHEYVFDTQMRP